MVSSSSSPPGAAPPLNSYKEFQFEDDLAAPRSHTTIIGASDMTPSVISLRKVPRRQTEDADEALKAHHEDSRNIVRYHTGSLREDLISFLQQMGAYYRGTGWRSYEDYIGQRIMYPGFSDRMKRAIVNSTQVQQKIKELAETQAKQQAEKLSIDWAKRQIELEKQLVEVAWSMVDKMVARMDSMQHLKFLAFTINNILVRMYHQGIHVNVNEVLQVREAAMKAAQQGISLVFLPCHKSHIDYLTISFICFRIGLSLPQIIAGDNLDLPIVGNLLSHGGAFYIRRQWGDDQLYTTVVKEYVERILAQGLNFECFIEGTRSRTGKLLQPRLGILKLVLDAVLNGRAKDCIIVPMSLQYDKVIETDSYINELLGNPKEKESLWGLVTNTRLLQLRMGRVDVRFAQPYSLREYVAAQTSRRGGLDMASARDKITLLRSLGYQVLADINGASVVMPAALVGTVILTLRGRGIGRNELIRRVDVLRRRILDKKGRVADFGAMRTGEVVDRALNVMKDLIGERKGLLEPVFYADKRFELSFYRNQVMHLFVAEAIVAVAMYTKIKQGGARVEQQIPISELSDNVTFISQLLKSEFVFPPGGAGTNLDATLEHLRDEGMITIENGFVSLSDNERGLGRENYDFYCFLMWPFVETYWTAAVSLFAMAPPRTKEPMPSEPISPQQPIPETWVVEKDFHDKVQLLARTLYYEGDISYFEAVNKETLKNAFTRLEEMGILKIRKNRSDRVPSMMAINPQYIPRRTPKGGIAPVGKLWDLVEQIGKFRREGKNRRDNATVSVRVLWLAEQVGSLEAIETVMLQRQQQRQQQRSKDDDSARL